MGDFLKTKTGGAYIPPAKLRMLQQGIEDKSSTAYQRLAWEALKKATNGLINKINTSNITVIVRQLFRHNLVRGRGLLCRSLMTAQSVSPTFTSIYSALISVVNTKFPNIGELLLKRLIIQFRRGYKRNDKPSCMAAAKFIAHLVNQQVAHEVLALEILTLLLEHPTEDSVEVAIGFLKEVGARLEDVSPKGAHAIFERLRHVLHEAHLDKRVQYMIEVMFQVRKDKFKDFPSLAEGCDLVEETDQFTHLVTLDDATDAQDILNVFKADPDYLATEEKYATLRKEILDESEGEGEDGDEENDDDEADDEEVEAGENEHEQIIDKTETNLVALRRTIYLTIQSSLDYEECCHKLLKMNMKEGQEVELCHMILDCCAQQRTYEKFFGLMAGRFCAINRIYVTPFETIFKETYDTVHRLDTNKLRNVSKFFAHLLFTDSISWSVVQALHLTEEDTTSSSRIFIKILFQELSEYMGLQKLNQRLNDPTLVHCFEGLFPRDHPKNTRFAINFFTSIGLGGLTDELRDHLKRHPKPTAIIAPQATPSQANEDSPSSSSSSSSSSSDSSDSSSSNSSSDSDSSSSSTSSSSSESPAPKKKKRSNRKKSESNKKTSTKKRKHRPAIKEEKVSSDEEDRELRVKKKKLPKREETKPKEEQWRDVRRRSRLNDVQRMEEIPLRKRRSVSGERDGRKSHRPPTDENPPRRRRSVSGERQDRETRIENRSRIEEEERRRRRSSASSRETNDRGDRIENRPRTRTDERELRRRSVSRERDDRKARIENSSRQVEEPRRRHKSSSTERVDREARFERRSRKDEKEVRRKRTSEEIHVGESMIESRHKTDEKERRRKLRSVSGEKDRRLESRSRNDEKESRRKRRSRSGDGGEVEKESRRKRRSRSAGEDESRVGNRSRDDNEHRSRRRV